MIMKSTVVYIKIPVGFAHMLYIYSDPIDHETEEEIADVYKDADTILDDLFPKYGIAPVIIPKTKVPAISGTISGVDFYFEITPY